MMHKSDLEIAREATLAPIRDIAASAGLEPDDLELYGPYMSKISAAALQRLDSRPDGKLILVTAISPTPAGEGKTTVTIGLADALNASGRKAIVAIREPSLGPVMGLKGGAAGGGYAQVLPMENINLHFTGDLHAITAANNAISALLDNHIFQGNELDIDPRRVIWKRALDMNDRALRKVIVGLGGPVQGVPREDGFDITVASEVMAVLCLSTGIVDLKARLARMVVGYTFDKRPVTVGDLRIEGALALLLREAVRPNLVQTIHRTPAFVHGGPFANIAHGCNSLIATRTALKLGDWVVTEGGFGADLGAEKFLNIKTPRLGKAPDAVVIVATIRSLKMHGGLHREDLGREDVEALRRGFPNLLRHVESIRGFGLPAVVAINRFNSDTGAEVGALAQLCAEQGVTVVHTEIWARGPAGGGDLAEAVVRAAQNPPAAFTPTYAADAPLEDKISAIVTKIYGGSGVHFSTKAREQMGAFAANGWDRLPVCMAKTQYSLSDDPALLGRPTGFTVTVRELAPRLGAGFIVAFTGDMLTMPGLPRKPAALNMDVDRDGAASGLF